ncbi:MAG: hypothetical protein ACRDK3_00505 [Actinomycetota bacterium]
MSTPIHDLDHDLMFEGTVTGALGALLVGAQNEHMTEDDWRVLAVVVGEALHFRTLDLDRENLPYWAAHPFFGERSFTPAKVGRILRKLRALGLIDYRPGGGRRRTCISLRPTLIAEPGLIARELAP